ncbi:MAG: YceI family protein [Chloroflexales bacterium]|nr:YceI family protein [Chloroflexales bacterium]
MRYRFFAAALLAGLLAGCGGAPAAAPTLAPAATEAPAAPTLAPAAATEAPAAATEAPAAATTSDTVAVFRIVPAESQVTYEVGETFLNQNNRFAVAVGNTQEISGAVSLDRASPRNSEVSPIQIDISTFASDSARRDNAIRDRWLESARFPIATFVPTQIEGLPETYSDGQELTLTITGDLTVRDVTKPVTFTVTGKVVDEEMSGVASAQIKMSDFGFTPPDIAGMLRAEDDVKITFTFLARPEA